MNPLASLGYVAPALLALSFLGAIGCAHEKTAPPVNAPVITSAAVTPLPKTDLVPAVVVVSPSVRVDAELAAKCKLEFNDAASAPKFDFDASELSAEDDDILSQIARCVTTGPLTGGALDLVGRADPRGESEYNMALGDRRASSVGDYLSSLGVDRATLTLSSRGKLDATGTDESGWLRDRRVDILLH